MAQLSSPGISVTVVDESFYTPAAPGTVPLIIVASQQDKINSAGTGIAPGTLKANAGKVYLLTSQADLGATFGVPYFQTDASNNPVHAGELNEYGLEAAYSFLGVSNRAYVVRADVNTTQLIGTSTIPTSPSADGTYWWDIADTHFGIFQWNSQPATTTGGQLFADQGSIGNVSVITDTTLVSSGVPLASYGNLGDYAVVATTTLNKLYLKKFLTDTAAGTWVEVGTAAWAKSWPSVTGTVTGTIVSNTFTINGSTITTGVSISACATAINTAAITGVTAAAINGYLQIYSTGVNVVIAGTSPTTAGLTTGTYLAPKVRIAPHYQIPQYGIYEAGDFGSSASGAPTGSVWIKTTNVNLGADWVVKKYNADASSWILQPTGVYKDNATALYNLDSTGGGINLALGRVYVKYNDAELSFTSSTSPSANFKLYVRTGVGATSIVSGAVSSSTFTAGSYSFTFQQSVVGSASLASATTVSFTATGATSDSTAFLTAFSAANTDANIVATLNTSTNVITITHLAGGDISFVDGTGVPLSKLFSVSTTTNFYAHPNGTSQNYMTTLWSSTVSGTAFYTGSQTPPTTTPADNTLWYNSVVSDVDVMVHNGTTWVGYLSYTQNAVGGDTTDPAGPLVSATQPTKQSDGTPLANGDLWINTSDLENYPRIYKFNYLTKKWVLLDNADQTSGNGVLFADARWSTAGANSAPATITALLSSGYLDPDAPDPALYPKGMLLWNTRRSGFNVKKYHVGYIDLTAKNLRASNEAMTGYYANRWVTESPNNLDGSGAFGRKSQRAVVLKALNALIQSNQQIRQPDTVIYNLLSCPGYLETTSPLVGLNVDNGETAFIVADAPARLAPDATTLSNWGNNTAGAAVDGEDGLIATSSDLAVYYPWGYTTDLTGNNIVIPPSHIMLRTIALSDNVSYPWFAPAGVRRGGVTNASSVGYVNAATGEFETVALNVGQRDTLAAIHVNPITYIAGTGLVCYGQKTRQLIASSLDRINVARLVIYLRYQLNQLAKPFVFEPNDTITRNEMKQQVEKLLLELTAERALYDYLVVCDTSNNTPARIDRNELHVDIAIEPVKAVEFIYIPLRLENTGAIKGLGQ